MVLQRLTLLPTSVVSYDVSNATLVLEHNYPSIEAKPAQVSVNVNLIFESLKSTDLQIGVWHNVIGYVSRLSEGEREGDCEKDATLARSGHVNVQAILMWSAGSIKLGEYERILSDQGEVEMLTKG